LIVKTVTRTAQPDWAGIAHMLEDRTPRQCRERWRHYLRPEIKPADWNEDEDRILEREYSLQGPKWTAIAIHLPGRTAVNVKNRWTKLCRNRARRARGSGTQPPLLRLPSPDSLLNQASSHPRPLNARLPSIVELWGHAFDPDEGSARPPPPASGTSPPVFQLAPEIRMPI
jgi:hypothetical protein